MKWVNIDIDEEKMNKLMTIVPKLSKLIKEEVEKISLNGKERIVLTHILIDTPPV